MTQYFSVDADPVDVGASLQICYSNPDKANSTIEVRMHNGEGQEETHQLALDANGHGCFNWTVPNWDGISIEGGDSEPLTVVTN